MPNFFYTGVVDREIIVEAELDARFADLTLKANTTKFDLESFRTRSVRYRHLREPPIIRAEASDTGTGIFAGVLNKVNVWNWTGVVIAHVQVATDAENGVVLGNSVLHLHARYFSHDWEPGAYEIGIGFSVDGGATYTYLPYSRKFVGYMNSHVSPLWTAKTTHYHTGALANWWSKTMYGRRETHAPSMVKNSATIPFATITHWAVGIRVNGTDSNGAGTKDVHELDFAELTLTARDTT